MGWKTIPCHAGCLIFQAVQFSPAIVRMLGKAVKVRHCTATVSAPVRTIYSGQTEKAEFSQRLLRKVRKPREPLKPIEHCSALGRWLETAQVRRPVLDALPACVPRGTKEP